MFSFSKRKFGRKRTEIREGQCYRKCQFALNNMWGLYVSRKVENEEVDIVAYSVNHYLNTSGISVEYMCKRNTESM